LPCYSDFDVDGSGTYEVNMALTDIEETSKSWYLLVLARDRELATLTDEAAYTVSYRFVPEPPPTPTAIPSKPACDRFTLFCGELFTPESASQLSHGVALAIALLSALAAWL
jgi:hypothetical protein